MRFLSLGVALAAVVVWPALAAETDGFDNGGPAASFNDLGATGLLQMPTGRMAPDGEMALGVSRTEPYGRLFFTLQALPWLQGTFRYTNIEGRPYGTFSANARAQSYKDKGIDLKLRLTQESEIFPEISIGFQDIGGTGLFSSEYIVATRRYYNFDFTGGIAWGAMGSRGHFTNPLTVLGDGMKSRQATGTGNLTGSYFRGETIGLFGGVEWRTPVDGLRLKAEYDGNDYSSDPILDIAVKSPINVGASYAPFPWLDVGLGWERGNTLMVRAMLRSNLNTDHGIPNFKETPPLPAAQPKEIRAVYEESDGQGASPRLVDALSSRVFDMASEHKMMIDSVTYEDGVAILYLLNRTPLPKAETADVALGVGRLLGLSDVREVALAYADGTVQLLKPNDLARHAALTGRAFSPEQQARDSNVFMACTASLLKSQDFTLERAAINGEDAWVQFNQGLYRNAAKAAGRVARAMASCAPPDVLMLHTVEAVDGLPVVEVAFYRRDVQMVSDHRMSAEETWARASVQAADPPDALDWRETPDLYPSTFWSLSPKLRQSIGGPDSFYLYQIYAQLGAGIHLNRHITMSGSLGTNLVNNFDSFNYEAPSKLPRVRSKIKDYLTGSSTWLNSLHVDYTRKLAPEVYAAASAGLFELMYGGVAGHVYYRPQGKRWSLGFEIAHVWQRDYDGQFGFLDYNVTTSHLTYAHDLPWWNLTGSVSVGRYLAKDIGATFSVSREFDNGTRMGVWATKTDVSAAEFGEGSFDKGMFISIPLDIFSTKPNRNRMYFAFRPLTRDGGQRAAIPVSLQGISEGAATALTGWDETWK